MAARPRTLPAAVAPTMAMTCGAEAGVFTRAVSQTGWPVLEQAT